uniref:Phospholipid scramblase n=1 Tax=Caenorhabditis japonica TaxID=281687 RepID=A0A8R1E537_CAEJA
MRGKLYRRSVCHLIPLEIAFLTKKEDDTTTNEERHTDEDPDYKSVPPPKAYPGPALFPASTASPIPIGASPRESRTPNPVHRNDIMEDLFVPTHGRTYDFQEDVQPRPPRLNPSGLIDPSTGNLAPLQEGYGDDEELVPDTVGAEDSQSQCYPGHVKAPLKAFVAPKTNPKRIRPMLSRLAKAGNINYVHITDSEDVSTISYRRFSLPEKTCVHTCEISEGYASPPECCGFYPRELEPSTFLCFGLNATVYSK